MSRWCVYTKDIHCYRENFIFDNEQQARQMYEDVPNAYILAKYNPRKEQFVKVESKEASNPYPQHTSQWWDWELNYGYVGVCI